MSVIDISGLDKVELLRRLFENAKKYSALFFLIPSESHEFDVELAKEALAEWKIEYFMGMPIKCNFRGNTCDASLYDRDTKEGAFEKIVHEMRK